MDTKTEDIEIIEAQVIPRRHVMKMDVEKIKKQTDDLDTKELIWCLLNRKVKLSDIPTFVLCDELRKREGVKEVYVEPHEHMDIPVEGWASVLIVVD